MEYDLFERRVFVLPSNTCRLLDSECLGADRERVDDVEGECRKICDDRGYKRELQDCMSDSSSWRR